MRFDLVITNGRIVDGTGGAAYYGDVGVKAGRIAAIGKLGAGDAAQTIDAAGKIVAPGHITQHAHYDAMLFWNPYCSNSGENGVTTVVNANCGFGFAPVRPDDRERTMLMMETTEQIPVHHQRTAMTWDWISFPEFLARVRKLDLGVNVLTYLPVNPLMIYVMGLDAAKTRKPTAAEYREMHRLINEAMDAGALGISMSVMGPQGNSHTDYDGTPMPTDSMALDVAVELARAVADRGEGVIQLLAQIGRYGNLMMTEEVARMAKGSGARVVHNIFNTSDAHPERVEEDLRWLDALRDEGLDVTSQFIGYRGWVELGIRDLDTSVGQLPPVREITACTTDQDLLALISKPDFQAWLEREYQAGDRAHGASALHLYTIVDVGRADHLQWARGKSVDEVARQRGETPMQALLNLGVESKLALQLKSPLLVAADPRQAVQLMSNAAVSIGVSDGGAHTKAHSLGHYGTDYLVWLVREEALLSVEQMHFQLSLKPAQTLQLRDRGAILPGFWADLLIYDLGRLYVDASRTEIVNDMPEGDWRRRTRAGGYDLILVNGVVTHVADQPTGETPGQFVQVTTPAALSPLAAE